MTAPASSLGGFVSGNPSFGIGYYRRLNYFRTLIPTL